MESKLRDLAQMMAAIKAAANATIKVIPQPALFIMVFTPVPMRRRWLPAMEAQLGCGGNFILPWGGRAFEPRLTRRVGPTRGLTKDR